MVTKGLTGTTTVALCANETSCIEQQTRLKVDGRETSKHGTGKIKNISPSPCSVRNVET